MVSVSQFHLEEAFIIFASAPVSGGIVGGFLVSFPLLETPLGLEYVSLKPL